MNAAEKSKMTPLPKLIHVGILHTGLRKQYIFLRRKDPFSYVWFQNEQESGVSAESPSKAILKAHKHWKLDYFRTLNCGFRYTLPERDEHGINALFHQMIDSYNNSNGVYFDEELGCNCFINFASTEALELAKELKKSQLL